MKIKPAAHTPMPWKAEEQTFDGKRYTAIVDAQGHRVAILVPTRWEGVTETWTETENRYRDQLLHAVNAHEELLKAAKSLLSVAESWIHDELDGTSSLQSALDELEDDRQAIAKAEGK